MAPSDEWALARSRVGLLDRRDFGVLELTGRDRATFLHALLSNEIKALAPGQGCAATLLDVHGKVQVVVFVWVADDRIFLVTPPAMAEKVAEALDGRVVAQELAILRHDPIDLRLLEHDLRHEHAVRLSGAAPGQVAAVLGVPGEQTPLKTLDRRVRWPSHGAQSSRIGVM